MTHPRTAPSTALFQRAILRWFEQHRRDLPWRRTRDPWHILVSEIMLQQTQVDRVIPKYEAFLRSWPTPAAFASASLGEALEAWSGLGYNRRCKHLHEAANHITRVLGGKTPTDVEALQALKGIGPYTARAVASFAANADVALWDTNVRRIALRYFFGGEFSRREPTVEALQRTLDAALPKGRSREWHGALMDFGSALCVGRAPACSSCPLRSSCKAGPKFERGYAVRRALVRPQAKFEGSRRQARGLVLRALAEAGRKGATEAVLHAKMGRSDAADILDRLVAEGMVHQQGKRYSLPHAERP